MSTVSLMISHMLKFTGMRVMKEEKPTAIEEEIYFQETAIRSTH